MEYKKKYTKTEAAGKRKNFRKSVVPSIQEPTEEQSTRRFENPLRPLMSEEDASRDQWNHGSTEHVALPRNGGTTDLQIYGSNTKY